MAARPPGFRAMLPSSVSILLTKRIWGTPSSRSVFSSGATMATLAVVGSQTRTAISTMARAAQVWWANSIEPGQSRIDHSSPR